MANLDGSPGALFEELRAIMVRLRSPDGCPWDREQKMEDLARYIREEADEVAAAIESGDPGHMAEELGDLLFNIIFATRLGEEEESFDMVQVITGIRDKLIRRHPHVYGDAHASNPEEVLEHWHRVKAEEKAKRNG